MTSLNHLSDKLSPSQLAMPATDLEISTRAGNALRAAEIKTVGELLAHPNLLNLPNLGRNSFNEIRRVVYGLIQKESTQAQQPPAEGKAGSAEMTRADMLGVLRLLWAIDAWAVGVGKPIPEFLHADLLYIDAKLTRHFTKERTQ